MTITLLILGIALLLGGGTVLVRGASELAENLGVSPLMVGLTIVAFGTSAPELVVNVVGALRGETALAFGNVAGSNLANLGLVLTVAALIVPLSIQGQIVLREVPLLLLGSAVLVVMALDVQMRGVEATLDRSDGLILILLFGVFVYISIGDIVRTRRDDPLATSVAQVPGRRVHLTDHLSAWALILGGAAALTIGAQMTVTNGVKLAIEWSLQPSVVGMILVAIGTSLPEFVTSIIAAIRREADLCVGNVVGSNIFNGLLVLPVSALIRPVVVPEHGAFDLVASLLFAAALIPVFVIGRAKLGRLSAAPLLAIYLGYLTVRVGVL